MEGSDALNWMEDEDGLEPDDFEYTESFVNLPKPIGWWVLHNGFNPVIFDMYRKPRWITRYFMRVIFDITWKDITYE
jgi:hypothetical protein